jgi:hypothetical protein
MNNRILRTRNSHMNVVFMMLLFTVNIYDSFTYLQRYKMKLLLTFLIIPLIISSLFLLLSCGEQTVLPNPTEVTPWCKLYTIEVDGWWTRTIYTTICDTDKQEKTSYTESCGKSCTRNVEVTTSHSPSK